MSFSSPAPSAYLGELISRKKVNDFQITAKNEFSTHIQTFANILTLNLAFHMI